MRPLRFPIAGSALICAALASSPASVPAQSPGGVLGKLPNPVWVMRPDTDELNNVVNRKDCLTADVAITFNLTLSNVTQDKVLQVWSGSDCAIKTNRDQNTSCVKVVDKSATSGVVSIAVKDMLQKPGVPASGVGTGTEQTCDDAGGSSVATKRLLWFLVLDPAALTNAVDQLSWEFSFDMVPPNAPGGATAGPGEQSIVVTFDPPADSSDLRSYRVYCSDDTGGCTSETLIAGQDPPAGMTECGSVNSKLATSVTATGLENGKSYAVAVTSEDAVGNTSPLSNVTCGIPQEVTGFYEAYRAAGGEAGGGFFACSLAPARRGAYGALAALALAAAALWRRRR